MSISLKERDFAHDVELLFAQGKAMGLDHKQLVRVAQQQLDLEKRLKGWDDHKQRSY